MLVQVLFSFIFGFWTVIQLIPPFTIEITTLLSFINQTRRCGTDGFSNHPLSLSDISWVSENTNLQTVVLFLWHKKKGGHCRVAALKLALCCLPDTLQCNSFHHAAGLPY